MTQPAFPVLGTANAVYFRKVLEEVGLFDDWFMAWEDVELSLRVYLKGYQLAYIPDAIVYHKHRSRYIDFLKQRFKNKQFFPYLQQKYMNIFKKPLSSWNDMVEFFLKQFTSVGNLFITIFVGKDLLSKTFPIFDMTEEMASFLGRIYGSIKLKLGIVKFPPLSNTDGLLWQIINEKVVISQASRNFYYVLDEPGTRIWKLLKENKDTSEIVETISAEYGVDKEEVEKDIISFVDELKKEKLMPK